MKFLFPRKLGGCFAVVLASKNGSKDVLNFLYLVRTQISMQKQFAFMMFISIQTPYFSALIGKSCNEIHEKKSQYLEILNEDTTIDDNIVLFF